MPRVTASPDLSAFTPRERAVVARCRTPAAVQRWLRSLAYNAEERGETLRSFRGVVRHGIAHCLEAALAAATVLEQHGYPPRLLSFESIDQLDHVLYVFQGRDGRWGAVARSRDPGLHGRKPVFATPRALAASYLDPYVDFTGRITGFAVADLAELGDYDWRLSEKNVWRVERWLVDYPHRRLVMGERRYRALFERYRRYRVRYPDRRPTYYAGRRNWL
jgi:phosphatidylserine/phosphatidylglycerophosphate/cardiolipin synthase-like enzyme